MVQSVTSLLCVFVLFQFLNAQLVYEFDLSTNDDSNVKSKCGGTQYTGDWQFEDAIKYGYPGGTVYTSDKEFSCLSPTEPMLFQEGSVLEMSAYADYSGNDRISIVIVAPDDSSVFVWQTSIFVTGLFNKTLTLSANKPSWVYGMNMLEILSQSRQKSLSMRSFAIRTPTKPPSTTESTTLPTESTSLPTESTTLPTESTTLPTESTTLPTESTTLPTESTILPTESTMLPTESTTLPTEDTTTEGLSVGDTSPTIPVTTNKPTTTTEEPFAVDGWSLLIGIAIGVVAMTIAFLVALCAYWFLCVKWKKRADRRVSYPSTSVYLPRLEIQHSGPNLNIVGKNLSDSSWTRSNNWSFY